MWKDTTSYSQGERGKAEPRTWSIETSGLRIVVTRRHGCEGWWGSCYAMGVEQHQLDEADIASAQEEFIDYLHGRASNWTKKLTSIAAKRGSK